LKQPSSLRLELANFSAFRTRVPLLRHQCGVFV
jgi:hypothetical protein